ncbi:WecB/TagA/CpsF family glycosyltransferase [Streptomyces sp. NPDC005931]|uniref:WecB/TagA/CpsF family glycosyltransferase n=1 Tax=Streptomyces sp. NPDC005931 TaxID=3364737 RepID=UPI003677B876
MTGAPEAERTWAAPDAPVVECLGVPITAHTRESAARHVLHLAQMIRESRLGGTQGGSGVVRGSDVHLSNAYTLALADRDTELRSVLSSASLNLPDGQSVVWASQFLHRDTPLPSTRVYGPDLVLDVFALSQHTDVRHFLLGSTPQVLDSLHRELRRRFPAAQIVGTCSPPFRPLTPGEQRSQAEQVRAAGADIVWVGLGTPKQDRWAAELCGVLPVVAVAVGAAFDFIAGTKPQAPPWMQRNGMEWLFRLGCEPRRLWRRYLFGNARFLRGVVRQATRPVGPGGRGAKGATATERLIFTRRDREGAGEPRRNSWGDQNRPAPPARVRDRSGPVTSSPGTTSTTPTPSIDDGVPRMTT